jgi:hypothetical protein
MDIRLKIPSYRKKPLLPLLDRGRGAMSCPMLNIFSILIGLVALVLAIPALIPVISLMNWIVFPIALVGFVVGLLSSKTSGRNLNIIILIVSGLRLFLTGGLI